MGTRPFGGTELGKSLYEFFCLDPLQQESISEGALCSRPHLNKASVHDG